LAKSRGDPVTDNPEGCRPNFIVGSPARVFKDEENHMTGGRLLNCLALLAFLPLAAAAQEGPYFITYSHQMEEPGNLEISVSHLTARPKGGNRFVNYLTELEYGVRGWWTTELYLHGQTTAGESTLFTGYRWENRFRVLPREHWINPVLYVEWEHISGADKTLKEIVGFDGHEDLAEPNAEKHRERKKEIEAKLILGSNFKGWNISENFVMEKNIHHEPFEFGYAIGVSRPLALEARPQACRFCRENFIAGLELYGGLGTHQHFGLPGGTSHYLAPGLAWQLPDGPTLKVSPTFGLTEPSTRFLLRFNVSYEIPQFGRSIRQMFR
jgi:hypothetical protein